MKAPKMVNLAIEETSGVDHPAHLHEGWMVIKAANPTEVDEIVASLIAKSDETQTPDNASGDEGKKEDSMPENTSTETQVTEEQVVEETTDALKAAEARIAELEEALAKASATSEDATEAQAEPTEDDLLKAAPESVRNMVEALRKSADEAATRAAAAEAALVAKSEEQANADAISKAREWAHLSLDAEKVGPALRRLAELDEELAKSIEETLSSVNAQAESANIFAEIGKSAAPVEATALDRINSLAKAAVAKGEAATFEQAFANVVATNPDLYNQHLTEKNGA